MSLRYNPALDGLRAIAVLAVVAYHAKLPIPAGFVGVDIFFVLSGYLITRLLAEELPQVDFLNFYARRARRILPAMALVVIATLVASLALLPDAHAAAMSAAAAAAFVANFFFQSQTGGYWSASAETMPLLHLWSLSVEEQFYFVWPVVLMLARKRPVAALSVIAVASFAVAEWLLWSQPNAAFYQMPARAWELAAGGLVALGAIRLRGVRVGLLLVMVACVVPLPHFPGLGAVPAVLGATWLISALHSGERSRVLEAKPMVWIGLISYSLYLWHWPLLALDRATRVGESPLLVRLGLCAVAVVLAALTYRFVETPFRRARGPTGRTVAIGLAAAAVLSVSALAAAPRSTTPQIAEAPLLNCYQSFGFNAPECLGSGKKVVLWGDSFAGPWSPLALKIAAEEQIPATRFYGPGCPATVGETIARKTEDEAQRCRAFNDAALQYIERNGADTVVIATNFADLFAKHPEQARRGVVRLVESVRPHVRRIVLVGPTPALRDELANCQAAKNPCMISSEEFRAEAAPALAMLAKLDALPGVEVVQPAAWYLARDRDSYVDREHVSPESVTKFLAGQRPVGVNR